MPPILQVSDTLEGNKINEEEMPVITDTSKSQIRCEFFISEIRRVSLTKSYVTIYSV